MRTILPFSLLPALLLISGGPVRADAPATQTETLCAACHGPAFSGGRVGAIAGGKWNRAKSDEDAVKIILKGIPSTDMVGFGAMLSKADAQQIVEYIKSLQTAGDEVDDEKNPKPSPPERDLIKTKKGNFKLERVGYGYRVPWSIAFLPDGKILVSERVGQLRVLDKDGKNETPITGLPKAVVKLEGGQFAIALHPDYANNGWVYVSFADPGQEEGTSMTKIVRGRIRDGKWSDQETVWEADQKYYSQGEEHYGCRLAFHRGFLFFTLGERSQRWLSQDLTDPRGKIHRVTAEGKIPEDNPFAKIPGAVGSIWSYGHRNPQGLAINPNDGDLWSVEHGPMGGDELNHVYRSENYGWPIVTFGKEHNGDLISNLETKPGLISPVKQFTPSIGATSVHVSLSDRYPAWKGNILVGSLVGQQLRRFEVKEDKIVEEETVFNSIGRIRDIVTGPDGYLYLAIEHWGNPGEILRVVPLE